MAYNSQGKTFTDHPLMDEICFACKTIFNGIVVKNDVLAANSETKTSLTQGEIYILYQRNGYITFGQFPFTYEIIRAYYPPYNPVTHTGVTDEVCKKYAANKYIIPESDRSGLTDYANQYFEENFEEQNDYYRSLMGLPPYDTGDEFVFYILEDGGIKCKSDKDVIAYIPTEYIEPIDYSLPLHEQPDSLIDVLYYYGTIDQIRKEKKGSGFSYILHLGPKAIDLFTARTAGKWDILYMPNVQYQIEDRFLDLYKVNKELYETRTYQPFFAQAGEYYDQMMILMLLSQTFADLVVDVPEWYIRRDIFDIRSCQYFLDSNGVKYFKEIPLRYQIRIVKNLNNLIKYKSSNQNFADIIDIFDIPDTHINKYWLHKNRKIVGWQEMPIEGSTTGETDKIPILGEPELDFVASDVNESYDDYIKDNIYRTPYDDITLQDRYWDGEQEHELVKQEILNREFSIEGTKYMSIEYDVSGEENTNQMAYALGLILDTKVYEGLKNYKIPVPSIDEFGQFAIPDLFLMLEIISITFYTTQGNGLDIKLPDDTETPLPKLKTECKWVYDWKKHTYPDAYTHKNGRVLGFNNTLDKDELIRVLNGRHSFRKTRFGLNDTDFYGSIQTDEEYQSTRAADWINEIGVNDFIVPDETIDSPERFEEVYFNNIEICKKLKEMITNASDQDEKLYLEYAFQEMFTKPYDKYTKIEGGTVVDYTNLVDLLRDRNFVLYRVYKEIESEQGLDARQDLMRQVSNDIIDTLDYYISSKEGFEALYSFTATESMEAIVKYLWLMITFFKSYKVYFLDPYYSFHSDDKMENYSSGIDGIREWNEWNWKMDKQFSQDIATVNDVLYLEEYDPQLNTYEIMDIYAHYEPDPLLDLDIDGLNAARGETEQTEDIDCGDADFDGTLDKTKAHPYVMLNGGFSYQGLIDFSDINGGDANETYEEYYEVDGGDAYHEYDFKTDAMGSQNFNYMIDGGSAHGRNFMNSSGNVKLVGTEFSLDIFVSERDSCIILYNNGLYVDKYTFEDEVILEYMIEDLKMLGNLIYSDGMYFDEMVRLLTDENYRIALYESLIRPKVASMEKVVDYMTDDHFKNDMKGYIDSTIANIKDLPNHNNPYGWVDL